MIDINSIEKQIIEFSSSSYNDYRNIDFNENSPREFTIMFIGEFNSGKSSLINAIIGSNILPTDIIPTTRYVYKIRKGDEKVRIIFENKQIELTLKKFLIEIEDYDSDDIKFIELYLNNVPDNICIIDTPGTNDITNLSKKLIYEDIPKADLLFFVMRADQAFKKSELIFLKDKVFSTFINKIVFIINKVDLIEADNDLTKFKFELDATLKDVLMKIRINAESLNLQPMCILLDQLIKNHNLLLISAKYKNKFEFNAIGEIIKNKIAQDHTYNYRKAVVLLNYIKKHKDITYDTQNKYKLGIKELDKELLLMKDELNLYKSKLKSIKSAIKEYQSKFNDKIDNKFAAIKNHLFDKSKTVINSGDMANYQSIMSKDIKDFADNLIIEINNEIKNKYSEMILLIDDQLIKTNINSINSIKSVNENNQNSFLYNPIVITMIQFAICRIGWPAIFGTLALMMIGNSGNQVPANQLIAESNKNIDSALNKLKNNIISTFDIKIFNMFYCTIEKIDVLQNKLKNTILIKTNNINPNKLDESLKFLEFQENRILTYLNNVR